MRNLANRAARRELLEETGFTASDWHALGSGVLHANRGCGSGHLFLALKARRERAPTADDLEEQELLFLSAAELAAALERGEFKSLAWSALVALALRHLKL